MSSNLIALTGVPTVRIVIENVRLQPKGDGHLQVMLFDCPEHALCWHALEDYALQQEVIVQVEGERYSYYARLAADEAVYLLPYDNQNDCVPHNDVFAKSRCHLILTYS